jgi:hypothetical protein
MNALHKLRGPRPLPALAAAALALALLSPAAADDDKVVRRLDLSLSTSGVSLLDLEVPVGETAVEGGDGDEVDIEVEVRCDRPVKARCSAAAEGIELVSARRGERLAVEIKGWPKAKNQGLTLGVRVRMPHDLDLDAEMGVGEFDARGLTADLTLDMGVGEVRIHGRERSVRRVALEVGVGEALLRLGDREIEGKGFIGRELAWNHGKGTAALEVACGVGEIDVRLDD